MNLIRVIAENWVQLLWFLGYVVIAAVLGLVCSWIASKIIARLSRRSRWIAEGAFYKHCKWPIRWFLIAFFVRLLVAGVQIPDEIEGFISHLLSILIIAFASWLVIKLTYVLQESVFEQFQVDVEDNLQARKIHTQLNVLKRIVTVIVFVLALGMILMTFERVRQLGTTILASAGIIGIVVGMAAQKTIGTFIAGLQIAFTQPIRVDDVVIVENEWGRIEEITLTYVVVRIWDLRRLVVPITYFIEKPFQNWTRVTADILGTVYIYADYTLPIEEVRKELERILKGSELWDQKVCVLQVTNATERTVEVRALMSADDASKAWSLRCEVREKLIEFIQKNYPDALPKVRAELEGREKSGRK